MSCLFLIRSLTRVSLRHSEMAVCTIPTIQDSGSSRARGTRCVPRLQGTVTTQILPASLTVLMGDTYRVTLMQWPMCGWASWLQGAASLTSAGPSVHPRGRAARLDIAFLNIEPLNRISGGSGSGAHLFGLWERKVGWRLCFRGKSRGPPARPPSESAE